jgi:hypothetical protein
MEYNTLVESSFWATINAPFEKVGIASWCFTLPEADYESRHLRRQMIPLAEAGMQQI